MAQKNRRKTPTQSTHVENASPARRGGFSHTNVHELVERGALLHAKGQLAPAIHCYKKALALIPDSVQLLQRLGAAEAQIGRFENALTSFERCLELNPDNAAHHNNRANVLREMGRFQEALLGYEESIKLRANYPEALNNRGVVLHELGQTEEALASFSEALQKHPNNPEALNNKGRTLAACGRFKEALENCQAALLINPNFLDARYNCGSVLKSLGRFTEALEMFNQLLLQQPNHLEALNEAGNIHRELKQYREALTLYGRALKLAPGFVKALNNQGNSFRDLKQLEQAQQCYRRALEIEPGRAEIHFNLAVVLEELGRFEQALEHYLDASRLQPDQARYLGAIQHVRMFLCDWTDFDSALANIEEALSCRRSAIDPFASLALFDRPQLHRIAAELFIGEKFTNKHSDLSGACKPTLSVANRRPRIGYFSSDFHNHATMHLLLDVLKYQNQERFDYYAFSFGPQTQDSWQQAARACFRDFFDVRDLSDAQVCELSRHVGIDIAVDLKGFTQDARMGVFAARAAPLQLSYLGYPGTIGAAFMDYAIVDREVVPDGSDRHFTESLIYFPGCYQPNMRDREVAKEVLSRTEHDLPEHAVVFCCFNSLHKLTPVIFEAWMTILQAVDSAVLWLLGTHELARRNLHRRAEEAGVTANRIIFANHLPVEQHLNRIRHGDVFLDTYPYSAHTTASDALRMGVPLITLRGMSFASRVASSILKELGLTELITDSLDAYKSLAIRLGTDPQALKALKQRVLIAAKTSNLFDPQRYSKELEAIYEQMLLR